jgi:hypothetical protein
VEEGERQIEYMRTVYREMQLKLQPLVVSEPGGTVVVYDDYRLLSEPLVKGIDICFKLIQVWQGFAFIAATSVHLYDIKLNAVTS